MQAFVSDHTIFRFWQRVPVLIRAVVLGFLVSTAGVGFWILSLMFIPAPWSLIVMVPFLWVYLRYLSGHWAPQSTSDRRSKWFRAIRLSPPVWKWSLTAAVVFVVVMTSGLMVTFRLIEYPAEAFKSEYNLDALPRGLAWLFLIMASFVAGICEEVGFRGYMQEPLERRYGPWAGIGIVSVVFVLVHLHQAWAAPILLHIFAVSVLFGILAYASGSLIPGMVGHVLLDIINFSYWWSDVAGVFDYRVISVTGVDQHFVVSLFVMLISLALFTWLIRKLVTARKEPAGTA